MAYEFDIFISYPQKGHVGPWVQNHFLPVLRDSLDAELADAPRISWIQNNQLVHDGETIFSKPY